MAGQPRLACGTCPMPRGELAVVVEKTAVPSDLRGTALAGGAVPSIHWSSATKSARSGGLGSMVLRGWAHTPGELAGLPATVCSTLESM